MQLAPTRSNLNYGKTESANEGDTPENMFPYLQLLSDLVTNMDVGVHDTRCLKLNNPERCSCYFTCMQLLPMIVLAKPFAS